MKVILKSKKDTHYAVGEYDGQRVTILPDSKINTTLSYAAMSEKIKLIRNNPEYVSAEGIILKERCFGYSDSETQKCRSPARLVGKQDFGAAFFGVYLHLKVPQTVS